MKNEDELENLIEEKSKELERFEVPSEIWLNIQNGLVKIPEKKGNLFRFMEIIFAKKRKLAYTLIAVSFIFAAYYTIDKNRNAVENITVPVVTENSIGSNNPEISAGSGIKQIPVERKTKNSPVLKHNRERRIAELERKAAEVIQNFDPYTKAVCESKILELNESISECRMSYKMSFNETIRKSLAIVYDKKAELLLDILKMN